MGLSTRDDDLEHVPLDDGTDLRSLPNSPFRILRLDHTMKSTSILIAPLLCCFAAVTAARHTARSTVPDISSILQLNTSLYGLFHP